MPAPATGFEMLREFDSLATFQTYRPRGPFGQSPGSVEAEHHIRRDHLTKGKVRKLRTHDVGVLQ